MKAVHVIRKPLDGSVAENCLEHGTGALNINGTRIASPGETITTHTQKKGQDGFAKKAVYGKYAGGFETHQTAGQQLGRWPPNVILQHLDECECLGTKKVKGTSIHGESTATRRSGVHADAGGHQTVGRVQPVRGFSDADGLETIADWRCAEGCPVPELNSDGVDRSRFYRQVKP